MTSLERQEAEGQVLFYEFVRSNVCIGLDCELIFRKVLLWSPLQFEGMSLQKGLAFAST